MDGETVIAGKALKNSMLLPLGIAVVALVLLLVIVLSARKRKRRGEFLQNFRLIRFIRMQFQTKIT